MSGIENAPLELVLIRHGETEWNALRRLQGQLDVPLNLRGERQAAALAAALRDETLDAVFCSDLSRARQTAQALANQHGVPLQQSVALRERCFGAFEGMLYADIAARFPIEHAAWQARELDARFPSGLAIGETLREFAHRAENAVLSRAQQSSNLCRIAVVAHGGVLEAIYRSAHGVGYQNARDFEIPNAGINRLRLVQGHWQILSWADVAHLRQLDSALDEIKV